MTSFEFAAPQSSWGQATEATSASSSASGWGTWGGSSSWDAPTGSTGGFGGFGAGAAAPAGDSGFGSNPFDSSSSGFGTSSFGSGGGSGFGSGSGGFASSGSGGFASFGSGGGRAAGSSSSWFLGAPASTAAPSSWGSWGSGHSSSSSSSDKLAPSDVVLTGDASQDTVTSVSFSPSNDFIIASSWDNSVRCWSVADGAGPRAKAKLSLAAPALCAAWGADGKSAFSGSADGTALMWQLGSNEAVQVAAHERPIKEVGWLNAHSVLATGSWDRNVAYWDIRQSAAKPQAVSQAGERVFAMTVPRHSVNVPNILVATANREILLFDLRKHQTPQRRFPSPLKHQIRSIASFIDFTGFVVGSIEGRAAIVYLREHEERLNFAYKCHRQNSDEVFAVNSIAFHPIHNTFSTGGSDGVVNWWDKESKQRLKPWTRMSSPVTATAFSHDGQAFVFATGYDWHKGLLGKKAFASRAPQICVHRVDDSMIRPKNSRR